MTENKKTKKLLYNTVFFFIGGIGAKFLQFLLLPLYTRVLSSSEYGSIDLLQTITALILPIITCAIAEAAFRFGMDRSLDAKVVISQSVIVVSWGALAMVLAGGVIFFFFKNNLIWLLVINIIVTAFRNLFSQFARSQEKISIYISDNVLLTFLICTINIVTVAFWGWGIYGYFLGYIVGNISSFIFLFYKINFKKLWTGCCVNKEISALLLRYSIPLIPNSICWWISNSLDRVMVSAILGVSANGILAVTYKIPNMLTIIFDFFIQAWQISANEEYDAENSTLFYNQIFSYISLLAIILGFWGMIFSKFFLHILVGNTFTSANKYIPIYLLAIVFFVLAQFLGTVFSSGKKTEIAFYTNLVAAVVNAGLNFFLIPVCGLYGAAFSTLLSYFVLWIIRAGAVKRYVQIYYSKEFVASILILLVQTFLLSYEIQCFWIFATVLEGLLFYLNRRLLQVCICSIRRRKNRND